MPHDFEAERAARRAVEAERSERREKLATGVADALTAETGDSWTVERFRHDDMGDGELLFADLRRERDGLTLRMVRADHNKPDHARFAVAWPDDLDGLRRSYRDAPGVRYDAQNPEATARLDRPAKTVAREIVRKILSADVEAAFAAMREHDRRQTAARDDAATWRDAVSEAAGITWTANDNDRGAVYWRDYRAWAQINSDKFRPGGTLSVALPVDPEEAAQMVAALRQIVTTGDKGGA